MPDILEMIVMDELDKNGLIAIISYPNKIKCNEEFIISARIENGSKSDWPGFGSPYSVLASYHWNNSNGEKVVYGGMRTIIQETIHIGSIQDIKMNIVAPNESGF